MGNWIWQEPEIPKPEQLEEILTKLSSIRASLAQIEDNTQRARIDLDFLIKLIQYLRNNPKILDLIAVIIISVADLKITPDEWRKMVEAAMAALKDLMD